MTRQELYELVQDTEGRIFAILFTKRTTGEERHMVCRSGVRSHLKGGTQPYNAADKGLVTVFDMQKNGYRAIPAEGVKRVKMNGGEWEEVS